MWDPHCSPSVLSFLVWTVLTQVLTRVLTRVRRPEKPAHVLGRFRHVRLSATPWTVAHQDAVSMGILQARILERVAISSSRGSSRPRDRTCICDRLLHGQADTLPLKPPGKPKKLHGAGIPSRGDLG